MNFNISLPDNLSDEIVKEADKKNVTPTQFIEILLNSIVFKDQVIFDYVNAAKVVIDQAEDMARLHDIGYTFSLNDLPYFQKIQHTVSYDGKIAVSTLKARIGKNFNRAVANEKVKNVKRARKSNNELKFLNGSAVYEVTRDE